MRQQTDICRWSLASEKDQDGCHWVSWKFLAGEMTELPQTSSFIWLIPFYLFLLNQVTLLALGWRKRKELREGETKEGKKGIKQERNISNCVKNLNVSQTKGTFGLMCFKLEKFPSGEGLRGNMKAILKNVKGCFGKVRFDCGLRRKFRETYFNLLSRNSLRLRSPITGDAAWGLGELLVPRGAAEDAGHPALKEQG